MYRASVGITTSMSVSATSWIGDNAETIGIDGIWVGEDIGIGQETTILAADIMTRTSGIEVGTGIIPIGVHNIATIARASLTLEEIGGGRFNLGLGIGGIQDLQKIGINIKKPVSVLRDAVNTLRRLFNGENVTIESELFSLHSFSLYLQNPVRVPIVFGVRGPQMLRLAGELADGVIISGPIEYISDAISIVNRAAMKADRKKHQIRKVAWLPTIPTFKGGSESLAKKVVALVVADTPIPVLDKLDVDQQRAKQIRDAVAEAGPKAGVEFVNQEFIDTFAISGTKEHMVDRFELLHKLGADEVVLGPPFSGNWRTAMTEIFQEIVSRREK